MLSSSPIGGTAINSVNRVRVNATGRSKDGALRFNYVGRSSLAEIKLARIYGVAVLALIASQEQKTIQKHATLPSEASRSLSNGREKQHWQTLTFCTILTCNVWSACANLLTRVGRDRAGAACAAIERGSLAKYVGKNWPVEGNLDEWNMRPVAKLVQLLAVVAALALSQLWTWQSSKRARNAWHDIGTTENDTGILLWVLPRKLCGYL